MSAAGRAGRRAARGPLMEESPLLAGIASASVLGLSAATLRPDCVAPVDE